jgi:hypothetical protein
MTAATLTLRPYRLPLPPAVWLTAGEGKVTVQWGEAADQPELILSLYRYQRGREPELLNKAGSKERIYVDADVKKGELWFYYTTFTDSEGNVSARSREAGIRVK